MSNFTSLENTLAEIQSLIQKMNAGKLQLEELESLHTLSRDLNERIVILKYKAYEEKVFGVQAKNDVISPKESDEKIQNEISDMSDFLTSDSNARFTDLDEIAPKQETVVSTDKDTSIDEPAFGFDLFESDSAPAFAPEVKPETESFSESRPFFSNLTEVKEEITETISNKEIKEEEISTPTPIFEEVVAPEEVKVEEVKVEEIIEEEVIQEEIQEVTSTEQPVHSNSDIFKNFQGLDSGSRLMSPKIQTLVGAFGLNEKLQCIRELYNGSSDAFNQSIEKVEQQTSFEGAKQVLAAHATENNWDLDSNLVNEFLQKVERRFL